MHIKNLLLTLTTLMFCTANAQKTYVPDDIFEGELILLGYDSGPLDDSVLTVNISQIEGLNLADKQIDDLTGIEGFTGLEALSCNNNALTTLDLTHNTELKLLYCQENGLTHLELPNTTTLEQIKCTDNLLTDIDVSNNTNLKALLCSGNKITEMDLSVNTHLERIECDNNLLTTLNVSNGNNTDIAVFNASLNPDLNCIQVQDKDYSDSNWLGGGSAQFYFSFDAHVDFSEDCESLIGLEEEKGQTVEVYPNPTTGLLHINIKETGVYELYSVLGQTISQSGYLNSGQNQVDLNNLDRGVYTVKVLLNSGDSMIKRVVKQ